MKKFLLYACSVLICLSCSYSKRYDELHPSKVVGDDTPVGRFKTTYLAEQIHNFFRGSYSTPLVVTTFVDVNNLYSSSAFGRIMAEQLISELAMKGYTIVEIRRADSLQIMEGEGEFALSRQLSKLQQQYTLGGIVVGTYAVTSQRVLLNVRILDPKTSKILSVASAEINNTKEIKELLDKPAENDFAPSNTMERVPLTTLSPPRKTPPIWPMIVAPGEGGTGGMPPAQVAPAVVNPPIIKPKPPVAVQEQDILPAPQTTTPAPSLSVPADAAPGTGATVTPAADMGSDRFL